ncbi:hypothetical protein [Streptococcus sp. zg-JUN1979]|uniref:hypothetical protein n=1 Tax=Streptococcus sp. zg-JUN1979 TaxID=3391450 RepID=UPI0039A47D35
MSKRSPKSVSEKLEIVLLRLESCIERLGESRHWTKYSKELKEQDRRLIFYYVIVHLTGSYSSSMSSVGFF